VKAFTNKFQVFFEENNKQKKPQRAEFYILKPVTTLGCMCRGFLLKAIHRYFAFRIGIFFSSTVTLEIYRISQVRSFE
jgi:hypothetical protein